MSRLFVGAVIIGASIVSIASTGYAQDAAAQDPTVAAPEAANAPAEASVVDGMSAAPQAQAGRPARGLRLNDNGLVVGYVAQIEPNSLNLIPVPNAIVSFVQNMKVVAQAKTNVEGRFAVDDLSPLATYSMFVNSGSFVAAFGTCVLPPEEDDTASAMKVSNDFLFVSRIATPEDDGGVPDASGEARYHVVQTVPWEDFYAAVNQGLFGNVQGPVTSPPPLTGPGAGGGAGGGGGGAGAGAALGAAFGAAAAAGALGAGQDEDLATPFTPN